MKAKYLMAFACGLVVGLAALAAEDARSSNIHGIVKVETATTNVLIAVPWSFYTPTGASTTNLPVDHLVWPKNLDDGDLLMLVTSDSLQTAGRYMTWMLVRNTGNSNDPGRWVPALTVEPGEVNLANSEQQIARGFGLWLIRQDPKDGSGNWKPFYLYGQYASGSASVSVSNETTAANAVMIANPFCQTLSVNEDVTWTGVGANDTLSIPNGTDAWDLALWDTAQQKWYISKSTRQGRKIVTSRVYNLTIPAGHGFWYIRRTVGEITITFNAK